MHKVLVNRLGGLSLPTKSVVWITDRPDMTLDVYRGHKTTIQQQTQVLAVTGRYKKTEHPIWISRHAFAHAIWHHFLPCGSYQLIQSTLAISNTDISKYLLYQRPKFWHIPYFYFHFKSLYLKLLITQSKFSLTKNYFEILIVWTTDISK